MPIYTPLRFRISSSPVRNPSSKKNILRRRRTRPPQRRTRPPPPASATQALPHGAALLPRRRPGRPRRGPREPECPAPRAFHLAAVSSGSGGRRRHPPPRAPPRLHSTPPSRLPFASASAPASTTNAGASSDRPRIRRRPHLRRAPPLLWRASPASANSGAELLQCRREQCPNPRSEI